MLLLLLGGTLTVVTFNTEYKNHLWARLTFLGFTVLMIIEIYFLFPKTFRPHNIIISLGAGLLFPLFAMSKFLFPAHSFKPEMFIFTIFFFYALFIFSKSWRTNLHKILSTLFLIIYPGLFTSFLIDIPALQHATVHLYYLIGLTFVVDGFAYFGGISIGRIERKIRSRPLFELSPGKTISGYVTGFIFGYIHTFIILSVNKEIFYSQSIFSILIFTTILMICIVLGDLFGSAFKRICNKKDSGKLMLGRGGVLDTFDSLLFAAPVYIVTVNFFMHVS